MLTMHTHHSHSGQFCQHAKNTLEEMILRAIELKFDLICLTEHMPRLHEKHLYPEEVESSTTPDSLARTFDEYNKLARSLQKKYADKIDILVGFESESISHDYMKEAEVLGSEYKSDMFVGSLHHSDDVPIDFDQAGFDQALKETASNDIDRLCLKYFIQLHGMIARLHPPVIGHFDLIRLYAPEIDITKSRSWPHIVRTIKLAVRNDCLFEVNSSGLRKGLPEPYPGHAVLQEIIAQGGKLCMSDDSHNIDQVATNYGKAYEYLKQNGVTETYRLKMDNGVLLREKVPLTKFKSWLDSIEQ